MSFFSKLLPVIAGLGVGMATGGLGIPAALGLEGAAAGAGAAGAVGAGAGAAGAGAATGALSAGAGSAAAAGAATGAAVPAVAGAAPAVAAPVAAATPAAAPASFLSRAAGWMGNHPMESLGAVGMVSNMMDKPPAPTSGLAPAQIMPMSPAASPAPMMRGPQDLGFRQNLISNLRRPY